MSKTKLETLIIDMYKELMKLGGNGCSTIIFGPEIITVVIKGEAFSFNAEKVEFEACKKFMADCGFHDVGTYGPAALNRLRAQVAKRLNSPTYNEYVPEEATEFQLKMQQILNKK